MPAVSAAGSGGSSNFLLETGIAQDVVPVVTTVAQRVIIITLLRAIGCFIALPQNRGVLRPMWPLDTALSSE